MEEEGKSEEVFQSPPQFESRLSRSKPQSPIKRYSIILFSIIVIGLVIFGATRIFTGGSKSEAPLVPAPTAETFPTDSPTPSESDVTPTVTPTKTPTPKPTVNPIDKASGLDRSKLSVHILNGSGVAGASKKASDFLESLGYNVVQIGNADNFNYDKTVIQIKSASNDFLSLLKKDIAANYSVGSTSADLTTSEKADAVVIIGKE